VSTAFDFSRLLQARHRHNEANSLWDQRERRVRQPGHRDSNPNARVGRQPIVLPARLPETHDDWVSALRALFLSARPGCTEKGGPVLHRSHTGSADELRGAPPGRVRKEHLVEVHRRGEKVRGLPAGSGTGPDALAGGDCVPRRPVPARWGTSFCSFFSACSAATADSTAAERSTNDVWIDPWVAHCRAWEWNFMQVARWNGSTLRMAAFRKVSIAGTDVESDYFVAAMPSKSWRRW